MAREQINHLGVPESLLDELSVQNGIIYKGMQVMVPQSMHKEMLRKIHGNHFDAESNIRVAREVLVWPGMRKSIQDMCDACGTCAQYGKTAPKEPMRSLPVPTTTTFIYTTRKVKKK